ERSARERRREREKCRYQDAARSHRRIRRRAAHRAGLSGKARARGDRGCHGFDAWRYTRPSITTVVSRAYEMGRYAGELLLERLGQTAFAKRNVVFPVTLQPGGSA